MSATSTEQPQAKASTPGAIFNVPNQLTAARLGLAVILFALLGMGHYLTSLALFVLAAFTDWIDGYWARRYGQVTVLGRILDPFADKIIICGTFVFLVAIPGSEVAAWMAVVVIGRELLVTALRSFLEERGSDFSASLAGKWKMVLQCLAVGFAMYRLSYLVPTPQPNQAPHWSSPPPDWLTYAVVVLVWAAVTITVYSGVGYIFAAIRMMKKHN